MKIFLKKVAEIKVGPSSEEGHFMGPLVSKEHLDKVMSCIERAKTEGGKVIAGGKPPEVSAENKNGYYLLPTVIEDLSNCSDLWQEEIFGPVITTMTFKYPKDAVKWANNSPYGLSASLWTQDIKRAHKIAQEIDAGTIWINTWMKRDLRVPFGGMKASGIGREGGEHSMDIYSEYKNICVSLEK